VCTYGGVSDWCGRPSLASASPRSGKYCFISDTRCGRLASMRAGARPRRSCAGAFMRYARRYAAIPQAQSNDRTYAGSVLPDVDAGTSSRTERLRGGESLAWQLFEATGLGCLQGSRGHPAGSLSGSQARGHQDVIAAGCNPRRVHPAQGKICSTAQQESGRASGRRDAMPRVGTCLGLELLDRPAGEGSRRG
jgi:hypothetical protein